MSITTVADIKAHSNIAIDADDDLIQSKIDAAEQWIAKFIGSPLDDATAFPDGTPEPLKEATRQLVAAWYEQREAVIIGVSADEAPFGVVELIQPYREWSF
jgi:hypothetical protein